MLRLGGGNSVVSLDALVWGPLKFMAGQVVLLGLTNHGTTLASQRAATPLPSKKKERNN